MKKAKPVRPIRWRIIHNPCGECIGTVGSITVPLESGAADYISADGYHQPAWCQRCRRNAALDFSVRREA